MIRTLVLKVALAAAIILTPAGANAKDNNFKQLSKIDGVEHVHVPKFLISLAAKNGENLNFGDNISIGDKEGNMLKKIETVDVFTCEKKDSAAKLSQRARSILDAEGWEPLVDVKDGDGQRVKIFQTKQGKSTTFVVFAEEEDETALVVIKGKLDIAKLLQQQMAADEDTNQD